MTLAARILFLLAAARALPQTTLLVMHTPKTGGTEFRNLLFARARERNLTLQAHYGPDIVPDRDKGVRQFDQKNRPADIVMGHYVNWQTLQPVAPGRRLRYATMLRSPHSWFLSSFLNRGGGQKQTTSTLFEYVRGHVRRCPGLRRDFNPTTAAACEGQLYAWHAGGVGLGPPERCPAFASLFDSPHHLLLVNERFSDSMWLLFKLLRFGSPPRIGRANKRSNKAYKRRVPLDAVRDVDLAIGDTCLPDIWAAARVRFERDHAAAREFVRRHPNTPIGALGQRMWPPLAGT